MAMITTAGIDHLSATRPLQTIIQERVETSPSPYPHWTLKEIFEQPQCFARALNYGGRICGLSNCTTDGRGLVKLGGLDAWKDQLLSVEHLIVAACGSSLFAGMYGQLLMEWLGCFDSVKSIDASELEAESIPRNQSGMLLVSQSGETLDVLRAASVGEQSDVVQFSIVNSVGSALARKTGVGVYLNAGREVAVASTKAFTCQVTVMALVACWFAQFREDRYPHRRRLLVDALQRLPVYAGMTLQCESTCKRIAHSLGDVQCLFVLGKGFSVPVAYEGALKIKEVGYVHAEGFPGGALKHGPFALIDEMCATPVILIVLNDQHAVLMKNVLEQVKARGARVIVITDDKTLVQGLLPQDDIITIPNNGPLTALLSSIPLQIIAYHLSVLKGINPDFPRGLAKTVTVS
eukprot:GHVR01151534.1.p1 GENE.GHVR01151534.1~~GHVR01151534.1.p1  ORF type:complete len:406 (+),score=77.43 GHVR01151534.1:1234-2451(+)